MPDEGLDSLLRRLEDEPENPWSAPSRFGAPGRLARALLRRLLRPYEVRERETRRELVRAVIAMRDQLEREQDELRQIVLPGAERLVVLESRSRRHGSAPEASSRRVLCSLGIGPYLDVLAVSSITFEAYAALHGYDLVLSTEPIAPERPPAWQKIALARRLLDSYEDVLWVDADAIFLDISRDVADLVRPGKDLYLVEHVWEGGRARSANTGVFLIRATDWSRRFLDRVWAARAVDRPSLVGERRGARPAGLRGTARPVTAVQGGQLRPRGAGRAAPGGVEQHRGRGRRCRPPDPPSRPARVDRGPARRAGGGSARVPAWPGGWSVARGRNATT